jgi:hypothetical protein
VSDNLFDPANTSFDGETPPFDVVITDAIAAAMRDVHTWLPAKITAVISPSMVTIQPLLKRKYKDGSIVDLPVIQNVQVIMPRSPSYWIKLPFKVGDTGIALFCERSLDVWNVKGGSVDPADTRTHDLSDAVFIPGLYPITSPVTPPATASSATDLVVHNGLADLIVQAAGKFQIKNSGNELINLLSQIVDLLTQTQQKITQMNNNLASATVATLLGPQPLSTAAAFVTLAADVTSIRSQTLLDKIKLDTLKGS